MGSPKKKQIPPIDPSDLSAEGLSKRYKEFAKDDDILGDTPKRNEIMKKPSDEEKVVYGEEDLSIPEVEMTPIRIQKRRKKASERQSKQKADEEEQEYEEVYEDAEDADVEDDAYLSPAEQAEAPQQETISPAGERVLTVPLVLTKEEVAKETLSAVMRIESKLNQLLDMLREE